ncbi:VIT1/CCC1 transporter family protein [Pseudomonas sp. AAC]|uniref:VIT1/CCC1 transporter family protein n=1 Tax=Pseudomonas sp. AAC TaxID=1502784 RepID=UPI0004D52767|nr:VIT1/CCC1 transporter family protein [Pseudomonas sp. AAC]KES24281.1 membrane protein [Pseudomonas sp. AAC]
MTNATTSRYRANLQGEVDGTAIYTALAEGESNPDLAGVFRRLAAVEAAHAEFWRQRMTATGDHFSPGPSRRARLVAWLVRRYGSAILLPVLAAAESFGSRTYDDQPEARVAGLARDERSHALLMQQAAGTGGLPGPFLAMLEGRHRGGGNTLRAAVLGANDGLVSNLSLVMGVAGAAASEHAILLSGLAGLIAGAGSMAMGEWLSVTSSRELYRSQIAIEADELRELPDEEREELILIYQAKGIAEPQARALAGKLLSTPATALDTLAREELGIDPEGLGGSAVTAAVSSFMLFAVGAIIPVLPFMFLSDTPALLTSLAASSAVLGLLGAGTSLFTGRGAWFSAARQITIGLVAAAATYGIGTLFGVTLG